MRAGRDSAVKGVFEKYLLARDESGTCAAGFCAV
jgi:hypothetical protein